MTDLRDNLGYSQIYMLAEEVTKKVLKDKTHTLVKDGIAKGMEKVAQESYVSGYDNALKDVRRNIMDLSADLDHLLRVIARKND